MNRVLIGDAWYELMKEEFEKEYFIKLKEQLTVEYTTYKCYPAATDIFKVFQLCPPEKVRVVMLSQDPYPSHHAHGIAFSSQQRDTPFSLQRILREVDRDVVRTKDYKEFKEAFPSNDLSPWVKQGVFLLNTVLTVRANDSNSHAQLGWRQFTNAVLSYLWLSGSKVWIVLGSQARDSVYALTAQDPGEYHYIIDSGHPASGAHGKDLFSGCNFASKVNRYFKLKGLPGIDWRLNAV